MNTEKDNVFYCDCGFSFERGRSGAHSCETGLRKKIAESEAKLAALAAENAGLKSFGDKLDEMHNELNGEGTGIQGRAEVACQQVALEAAMEEFDAIKTPETDAFLAEVQAQGVEMFAAHKRERQQALRSRSMRMSEEAAGMAADAENFADELRKGEQS